MTKPVLTNIAREIVNKPFAEATATIRAEALLRVPAAQLSRSDIDQLRAAHEAGMLPDARPDMDPRYTGSQPKTYGR